MNNIYIQDKLDAFRKFQEENGIFIKYLGEETQLKFTMYDDFLFQSLTDYHNHIVEKIKDVKVSDYYNYEHNEGELYMKECIIDLLQDTNPKE